MYGPPKGQVEKNQFPELNIIAKFMQDFKANPLLLTPYQASDGSSEVWHLHYGT